jgi:antitoxin component of RelBE/YafQ-DinJ toxin-antitoxin module
MATPPKAMGKTRVELMIDQETYKAFAHICTRKGMTPSVLVEKYMKETAAKGG